MTSHEAHPIVMWELTRACDLRCINCTNGSTDKRDTNELTTYDAYKAIDQIAALAPREFIMTGGDPLEREDVYQIVDYARRRGLAPALVASPTSRLTTAAIARLAGSGLTRIVFSLDGSTPAIHHAVHGVVGTFATTLRSMGTAKNAGLATEVNTLITRRNAHDLVALADLLHSVGIARWNLHFLVPMTVSTQADTLVAGEVEQLFPVIDEIRERENFGLRVVEAPHYRRFRLQRDMDARVHNAESGNLADFSGYESADTATWRDIMESATDSARGFVYISHAGDVRCSEFLLFSAGNLRYLPLGAIYRSSSLFVALRDPDNLNGKCGRCEFRHVCGGSRARAWAMTGNMFADDPLCVYEPGAWLPLPTAPGKEPEASS